MPYIKIIDGQAIPAPSFKDLPDGTTIYNYDADIPRLESDGYIFVEDDTKNEGGIINE